MKMQYILTFQLSLPILGSDQTAVAATFQLK